MFKYTLANGITIECDNTTDNRNDFVPNWPELSKLDECYCTSDFHLLKEFINRDEDGHKNVIAYDENKIDIDRLNRFKEMCKCVSKDSAFIFLGDITESEFDSDSPYIDKVKEVFREILNADDHSAPRILVRGNNDVLDKEVYKEFGFDYVVPKINLGNILFSHKPLNVDSDHLNIHGHLHEHKTYFDISPKNHINVYYETENGPQTVAEFIARFNSGKYDDCVLAHSEEYRTSDMIEDIGEDYE